MKKNVLVSLLALTVSFFSFETRAIAAASPADQQVSDWYYFLEAEVLGGYSEIKGRDGIGSTTDRWSVSPNYKASDSLYWLNVYNGTYDRSSQVVVQEDGGRRTETTQSHSISTAFKYYINPNWSLRPHAFADWVFVNETEDEDFGDGLYDYEDYGGGLESAWSLDQSADSFREVRAGFRIFDRQYPNYQSLISQVTLAGNSPTEINEKDFVGYKFNVDYEKQERQAWSYGAGWILVYKDFSDKRTIDSNGIRSASDTREDFLEYINVYAAHPINDAFRFRVNGQFALNISNLDFYDTHNTVTLTDDDFVKEYFDYYSFTINPTLTYRNELQENKFLELTVGYSFNILHYLERKAQNVAGVYGSEDQEDTTHTLSLRGSYTLTPNINWVTTGSYTFADSNQEFENFYLYNYDLWSVLTGISFKY